MLHYLLLLLLLPAVPARQNHQPHVQQNFPSEPEEYRDYEELNAQYAQDYENYDYDYQQQFQRDHQQSQMLHDDQQLPQRNKLLLIVLDGFRWDYFEIYKQRTGKDLEGFRRFMSEGVRTEYLESVFPAESFPAWQTIQTGLYPESHGIVGNQFYDQEVHKMTQNTYLAFFNIDDERTTAHMKWWQKDEVEPIWATAARHDVSFATFLWGRCDIPYDHVKRLSPLYCENYYTTDLTKTLRINVDKALSQLQNEVDAAIIYDSTLEKTGEDFGPFSPQTEAKLAQLDSALEHLENRLNDTHMTDFVNIVILSDHGMTYGHHSPDDVEIRKVKLSNHLKSGTYRWIVGSGSHAGIYPKDKKLRKLIVDRLKDVEGITAYERHDIPEELHYKHNKNAPPILVLAQPGTIILSSGMDKQRPSFNRGSTQSYRYNTPQQLVEQTKRGLSGYDPAERDMRGIFLAKGPEFKSTGKEYPAIKLVDVYQVLAHVLGIPPQANNGTWNHVMDLFVDPNGVNSRTCGFYHFVIILLVGLAAMKQNAVH